MILGRVGTGYAWGRGWSWAPPGSVLPRGTHQTCLASLMPISAARRKGDGAQHCPTGPQHFLFACGSGVAGVGPSVSHSVCTVPLAA